VRHDGAALRLRSEAFAPAQYDVDKGPWEGLTSDEPRPRTRVLELATAAAGNRAVPLSLER
jgi:hypothetical protein